MALGAWLAMAACRPGAYIGPGSVFEKPAWYEVVARSLGLSVAHLVLLGGLFAALGLPAVIAVVACGVEFSRSAGNARGAPSRPCLGDRQPRPAAQARGLYLTFKD
ncbi:MAG: hypothetical protein FJ293_02605 [Planctomycetes bacterium]|nr:hypothetical protein [Planctomycetota bacterium]